MLEVRVAMDRQVNHALQNTRYSVEGREKRTAVRRYVCLGGREGRCLGRFERVLGSDASLSFLMALLEDPADF